MSPTLRKLTTGIQNNSIDNIEDQSKYAKVTPRYLDAHKWKDLENYTKNDQK